MCIRDSYCGTDDLVNDLQSDVDIGKCNSPCAGDSRFACGGKGYLSVYNMPLPDDKPLTQKLVKGTSKLLGCYPLAENGKDRGSYATAGTETTNEVRIGSHYIVVDSSSTPIPLETNVDGAYYVKVLSNASRRRSSVVCCPTRAPAV